LLCKFLFYFDDLFTYLSCREQGDKIDLIIWFRFGALESSTWSAALSLAATTVTAATAAILTTTATAVVPTTSEDAIVTTTATSAN
jgi:hypothetical protein